MKQTMLKVFMFGMATSSLVMMATAEEVVTYEITKNSGEVHRNCTYSGGQYACDGGVVVNGNDVSQAIPIGERSGSLGTGER